MHRPFIDQLKTAVQATLELQKDTTPYGFAIITGQSGNYLEIAIATPNGLQETAESYLNDYKDKELNWEKERLYKNLDNLKAWLRWANPDDGWTYLDFESDAGIDEALSALKEACGHDDIDEYLEEHCIVALREMIEEGTVDNQQIILGTTYGEDPNDFLRTASMINSYQAVRRLWSEYRAGWELK